MKVNVVNLKNEVISEIELNDAIFSLDPRADILARVTRWQLAKRRSGNHAVKEIGDVRGSGKKIYKQKGTGGARHGSKRGAQFRGGGIIFGPQVRDHGFSIPKKVRRLGLCMALSTKAKNGKLFVVDGFELPSLKTKDVKDIFDKFYDGRILLIDSDASREHLLRGIANLHKIDVLPQIGANVYDILKKDCLILSVDAVNALQARLLCA